MADESVTPVPEVIPVGPGRSDNPVQFPGGLQPVPAHVEVDPPVADIPPASPPPVTVPPESDPEPAPFFDRQYPTGAPQ
jgi:hypothetical protein